MRVRLVVAPTVEPVSLAEAKAHLRITNAASDAEIDAMLDAAVAHLDGSAGILGRALCTQTWELLLDAFPAGEIRIPLPPLQSVTSITYVDAQGVTQTVPTSGYAVDAASEPGVVSLKYGQSWPATRAERNAVTVRFVAGYGAAAAVPEAIKSAIKLIVGDLSRNREAQGDELHENVGVTSLLFPYRMVSP